MQHRGDWNRFLLKKQLAFHICVKNIFFPPVNHYPVPGLNMKKWSVLYKSSCAFERSESGLEGICGRDRTGFCLILGSNAVFKLTQQPIPNMKLFHSQNCALLFWKKEVLSRKMIVMFPFKSREQMYPWSKPSLHRWNCSWIFSSKAS